jgi:hypothetical protein
LTNASHLGNPSWDAVERAIAGESETFESGMAFYRATMLQATKF